MKTKRYGIRPVNRLAAVSESDVSNVSANDVANTSANDIANISANISAKVSVEDDSALLLKVQKVKKGSGNDKEEFIKYVGEKYNASPNNGSGFIETLKVLCASVAGIGIGGGLAKTISHIIVYARTLISKFTGKSMAQRILMLWDRTNAIKIDKFTKCVGRDRLRNMMSGKPSEFNCAMVLTILVSALFTFVLYKVYKVLTKTIVSESKNIKAIRKYRNLEAKKAVLESHVLFIESNRLLEGDTNATQDSTSSFILKTIADATALCDDILMGFAKTGAYMMKTYPNLTAAILICIGYVYSF